MRKTYVLDTNVLLHDPHSLTRFVGNDVVIPIDVIEEIDRFKHERTERGHNARDVSRRLDAMRNGTGLSKGISLPDDIMLRVYWDEVLGKHVGSADLNILRAATTIQKDNPKQPVVIVSKDINLRLRADAMGLRAEDYESDRVVPTELYTDTRELTLSQKQFEQLNHDGAIPVTVDDHHPNEYVLLRSESGKSLSALARVNGDCTELRRIKQHKNGICGICPRNKEQYYAVDALTDHDLRLVTLMGKAGTGKTLLAMACALHEVLVNKAYRGLVVARPTVPVGKELGFLPGDLEQKMTPWMRPVLDTLEFVFESARQIGGHRQFDSLLKSGMIEIQAISLIRGRSINNRYIVVDEAQNLSPLEVKTIITRVGADSKVVVTGDPYQIDNPYVDSSSNGFNYLADRFRDQAISAHVELRKGERSDLAELAANLL
ncbi:MAG: PhoH family protein [Phycisphaerales bacterium]|nr:PhoH family protein [Phycisphaerales bacterium]